MTSSSHPPPPAPRSATDLYAIVYVSTAAHDVSLGELMHLLDSARRRNAEEGITGVLLHADRRFMQYLEGPAAGLSRVYDIIKAHPLHYGLIDLVREPVPARRFAEWAMAFHVAGAFGRASPQAQDAVLAQRLAAVSGQDRASVALLAEFWRQGSGALPSALLRHAVARARRPMWPDLETGTGD